MTYFLYDITKENDNLRHETKIVVTLFIKNRRMTIVIAYLILDLLPIDVPLHQIEQLQRVVETEVAEGIEALPDLLVGHVPGVDEPRDDLGVADGRAGVGQHVEELARGDAFGSEGGWKEKQGGGVEKRYASVFEITVCIFKTFI